MGLISNIQDKLSSNKDHTDSGANSSYDTTNTGGLPGQGSHLQSHTGTTSSHPTHGTTTTSNNPLSSNAPHGSSGITGGSHPLVSGGNNTTTGTGNGSTYNNPGYGSGEGSHLTGSTGQYSNTGPGLTGTSHSGGLTDSTHTGHGIGSNTYTTGSGLTGDATHHNTHSGAQGQHVDFVPASHPAATNHGAIPTAGGQKLGGVGEGVGHSSSHAGVHETMGDKVKNALPGQQGNAHDAYGNPINPSSTGPHTMSSHSSHPTSHNTGGITGSNTSYNQQPNSGFSSSAQPLSHDSQFNDRHSGPGAGTGLAAGAVGGAGLAGASHHNTHNQTTGQHGSSGLTGSNTHNTHNTGVVGEDNRGMMDKAKDALSSKRSNQPDDPITGTNYDQKSRDQYTDSHQHAHAQTTGTHGGIASHQQHGTTGLTGSNTHNTHSTHTTSNTHNTHNTGVVGEDNRGMMDKAKDALSSKRSNQPDDPITGTNYDQKTRDQYTSGTHGSGVTGSSHGNNTHNSSHQAGVAGITGGMGQTHLGSNTHSNTHSSGLGHDSTHVGRSAEWKDGYQAGYREAQLHLSSQSGSNTATHSGSGIGSTGNYPSTTGSGYASHTKPTMGEKMNPKTDADRDGKVGFMD